MSWKALKLTLESMNFYNQFINLVMKCVTTTSHSLLIEGEATNRFCSGKGLHQGNSISSVLFNFLMENMSQVIHLMVRRGKLDRYKIVGVDSINHLLFVDDDINLY